jgi:hypothetical protein
VITLIRSCLLFQSRRGHQYGGRYRCRVDTSPTSLIVRFVVFILNAAIPITALNKGIRALNGSSGYETGLVSC